MVRQGEYTYFDDIGAAGREHSVNKPFSDTSTPRYFMDIAAIYSLLPPPPARVLECGCGTGWASFFLARKGYSVTGQDCSETAIKLAQSNPLFVKNGDVTFICSDFESINYRDEFDAVIFYSSLHHAANEQDAIRRAYNALHNDGVFIAIEPGIGHEVAARDVINKYDVGDRDMPPYLVVKYGKRIGFRRAKVYQHPGQLASALYNEPPNTKKLKLLWRIPGMRVLLLFVSVIVFKRLNGLVWMQK